MTSTSDVAGPAMDAAAEAVRLASGDPHRAAVLASDALRRARVQRDVPAASLAERALGLAARAGDDLDASVAHLRRSIRLADRAAAPRMAAETRVALSGTLALQGRWAAALAEADRAAPALQGTDRTVLDAQRAFILGARGRLGEALEGFRRVVPVFRDAGDRFREARALANAAVVRTHLGDLDAAEADLTRAERLFEELALERETADVRQNLGWLAARRGDMPAALRWFDLADDAFRRLGVVDAPALQDRCEALLSARLFAEAREAAERAVAELERRGVRSMLGQARLLLAEAALLQGDVAFAAAEARRARRALDRHGSTAASALARHTELRVAFAAGRRTGPMVRAASTTAAALERSGWVVPALDARLVAAQVALELGRVPVADAELGRARRARGRGPIELRSRAWHAEALLRLARGERRGAEAALRAGLRALDECRAALGASELRAHASGHGAQLARLGLQVALRDGSPQRALAWAERWRAGALALPRTRPPDDPELAAELAELRRVTADVERARLEGRSPAALAGRQAALERSVRDRCRRSPGLAGRSAVCSPPQPAALRARLGDAVLVELMELDGRLWAVVLAGRRPRLHDLGPVGPVLAEVDAVHFALRRLALARGTPRATGAAADALAHGAARLGQALLAPVPELGDAGRPLVVVPAGALRAVPWSALPSCRGRPVSVAPSAALWWRAAGGEHAGARGGTPGRPVVLVAGPGLDHAEAEVDALGRLYPGATVLTGAGAVVDRVAAALDGAGLAHLAAHGRFRRDNPLFSSLQLGDGPLNVYELERLARAPRDLVLSACDSAVSGVLPGDELVGLGAALLGLGTTSLVASLLPVADAATAELMRAHHEARAAGLGSAAALARAQQEQAAGDHPRARAAAAAFVCLGAG